jgi:hypothetical protein
VNLAKASISTALRAPITRHWHEKAVILVRVAQGRGFEASSLGPCPRRGFRKRKVETVPRMVVSKTVWPY